MKKDDKAKKGGKKKWQTVINTFYLFYVFKESTMFEIIYKILVSECYKYWRNEFNFAIHRSVNRNGLPIIRHIQKIKTNNNKIVIERKQQVKNKIHRIMRGVITVKQIEARKYKNKDNINTYNGDSTTKWIRFIKN